jgi:hypothetical protein
MLRCLSVTELVFRRLLCTLIVYKVSTYHCKERARFHLEKNINPLVMFVCRCSKPYDSPALTATKEPLLQETCRSKACQQQQLKPTPPALTWYS